MVKSNNAATKSANSFKSSFVIKSLNLSEKQKKFLFLSLEKDVKIIFINGPAGSSKTYMSIYSALRMLKENFGLDLIYVRTIIESAEKNMGSLPGDANEKFNPYMSPLLDKLDEMLALNTVKNLVCKEKVKAAPINFLRGANWVDKIIIADEAQNFTFKELTTLITRLGCNSKLFICGDIMQSDINGKSGFAEMINLFNDAESKKRGIHVFKFTNDDIKRSEILKYIIEKLQVHSNP